MADEFDPCECAYNQDSAMQRLLTMLRQGQSYCTDSECMDPPLSPSSTDPNSTMVLVALWAVAAVALFFMRPSSARPAQESEDPAQEKVGSMGGNDSTQPPPPPPTA